MKDSIRISYKRKITRFCVFLITILMASTLVCTVCADNIPVLKNVDIRLGDTIGLLFHTSIPYDSNIGTVKASVNNRDISPHVTRYNNDNCYTFLVTGIYPHEISQKITLSLSEPNVQFQTSVKEELKKTLNNSASEDEKRFASDLLQYGEATWQYREHVNGTNRPCDITTNVDGYAPSGDNITTSLINIGNSISAVHISSIGIAYSDTNHYVIEVEVPQAIQAGAKIDIVFKYNNKEKTESITHEGGTQKYSFTSPALKAHKIATERIDVELKVNGTTVQTIDDYGLNNFIAQLSEVGATSDQGTALQYAKALYYYGESAATVYNDKRVFAQYIDTSAMQNPRFMKENGKLVFKCDNAKMHVYYYDGTDGYISNIAWTVENVPTAYHNSYDISVKGTARLDDGQELTATTKQIRVENTVTFEPSSTIFVATHDNGTLTLPAGRGEVTPAIGLPFQVEWAENTLSTTLEAADAKTATGMKTLTLSHTFIDKNDEEVVVDVPFVYCNTIKSIEVTSMHNNATWQKSDDGNFISFQPKSIRVFFDNGTQQDYSDIEAGWEVNAKPKDSVKYASSISPDSPYYEFSVDMRLPPEVFETVYGDLATKGRYPSDFQDNTYKIYGTTQLTNKVVSINTHEATMTYTGTSSCDVKIKFSLILESGENLNYEVQTNKEIQNSISGEVRVLPECTDSVRWSIYTIPKEKTLIIQGKSGVSSSVLTKKTIAVNDPIVDVQPAQAKPIINIFAKDSDTAQIPVTLRVKIIRASGEQEFADWTAKVNNICNGDNKKIESVKFQNGTCSVTAPVVIWNPIISFDGSCNVEAIDSAKTHILMSNKEINVIRTNGYQSTIKLNDINVPNIQDGTLSAERTIEYNEYSESCPLKYIKPQITVIVNNDVVAITPVSNPTAITLDSSKASYDIPVYLLCKNGKRYVLNGTDAKINATVTHDAVMNALGNATWKNNTAQCTTTCSYNGFSTAVTLSVTRAGGTIGSIVCGTVTLPSSANGIDVTVNFTVSYDTGSSVACQNTFRIYPSGTTTAGTKTTKTSGTVTVKLSYGDVTENCTISWINPVKSIEITTNPTAKFTGGTSKTTPTGGVIKVTYENGATQTKDKGFSWSQVTYTGTETQPKVTVKATYNGVSKSKSDVTAANPIESVDVSTKEYYLQNSSSCKINTYASITFGNGQSKNVQVTSNNISATSYTAGETASWNKESASLVYAGNKTTAYIYLYYTYEGVTSQKTKVTLYNKPKPKYITLTATTTDEYYLNDQNLKLDGDIEITLQNGITISVANAGSTSDITMPNANENKDYYTKYQYVDMAGQYQGKTLDFAVYARVHNRADSGQWKPVNITLTERINYKATDYCTEFNKFQVTLALTTYYTNGRDSTANEPTLIGADTAYPLCGGELGWEPKLLNNQNNYFFDNHSWDDSYGVITYKDTERWKGLKDFAKTVGDKKGDSHSAHVGSVKEFNALVFGHAELLSWHVFFTAPDRAISFNDFSYTPYPQGKMTYIHYDGYETTRVLTPLFALPPLVDWEYDADWNPDVIPQE